MKDEAAIGQVWEVKNRHYVSGLPLRLSYFLVVDHTDESALMLGCAWIILDLETGEIRLRTRLYSDDCWQRIT